MKIPFYLPLFLALTVSVAGTRLLAQGQTPAEPAKESKSDSTTNTVAQPLPSVPEERFKTLFTKAYLSGRWAALKDGQLGEERTGDKYNIVSAVKTGGDKWIVHAKMKYGDREFMLPIPVQMKFVGDTAILEVNDLAIPGGGTYTARVMFYERTYSGTWKGQRGGGMLYGTITNEPQ